METSDNRDELTYYSINTSCETDNCSYDNEVEGDDGLTDCERHAIAERFRARIYAPLSEESKEALRRFFNRPPEQ